MPISMGVGPNGGGEATEELQHIEIRLSSICIDRFPLGRQEVVSGLGICEYLTQGPFCTCASARIDEGAGSDSLLSQTLERELTRREPNQVVG